QLGDDVAQGIDDVAGEVRARGVPAGGPDGDGDVVRGRGDRADAGADLAAGDLRRAVQGVDLLDAVEDALVEELPGAARLDLLGGLEDEPHPDGQLPLLLEAREDEAGPEDGTGVDVVAAGVR